VWSKLIHLINYFKHITNNKIDNLGFIIFSFYAANEISKYKEDKNGQFGFFNYELETNDIVKIHFKPLVREDVGDLSSKYTTDRLNELKTMFTLIKEKYPDLKYAKCVSWLFKYESLCRLFPVNFIKEKDNYIVMDERAEIDSNTLWGQFMESNGHANLERYSNFLSELKKINFIGLNETQIINKFLQIIPIKVYSLKGDVDEFYKFYNII
jgi:hypothetical protein